MASSSLDASAKIYAGRVDAVHQETYKVLTGLGRSDSKPSKGGSEGNGVDEHGPVDMDENADLDGEEGDNDRKRKERKRVPNAKSVIVTQLNKIRSRVRAFDTFVSLLNVLLSKRWLMWIFSEMLNKDYCFADFKRIIIRFLGRSIISATGGSLRQWRHSRAST